MGARTGPAGLGCAAGFWRPSSPGAAARLALPRRSVSFAVPCAVVTRARSAALAPDGAHSPRCLSPAPAPEAIGSTLFGRRRSPLPVRAPLAYVAGAFSRGRAVTRRRVRPIGARIRRSPCRHPCFCSPPARRRARRFSPPFVDHPWALPPVPHAPPRPPCRDWHAPNRALGPVPRGPRITVYPWCRPRRGPPRPVASSPGAGRARPLRRRPGADLAARPLGVMLPSARATRPCR